MPGDLPIVGGAPSDTREVMALRLRASCGAPPQLVCSSIRVTPRALVTAAHCVADAPAGLFEIVREPDALDPAAIPIDIASIRFAPGGVDLAVIATTKRLDPPFAPLGTVPADPAGATVTIAGYGSDGTDAGGVRRAGTATIASFDDATLTLSPGPAITCGGDSGGPVLFGDELVAIISFGDPQCATSTTAIRIDASRAFIDDAIVTAGLLPEDQPAAGEADCGEPSGCCSAGASPDLGLALVAMLVLFVVACGKSKPGPCGTGRLHGDAPPRGTATWCTDASGTKHGSYREWWPSGAKKIETAYVKGRQDGAFASWHENGEPDESGTLTAGLRTGRWKKHFASGKLERETEYGAGGSEYRWTTYREDDGTRWMQGGFLGQREHGHFVEYYPDGKKMAEGDMAGGTKTGTWSYWNADGTPSSVELGSFAPGAFGAE